MKADRIAVIILAAGQSSRFGSAKMHHYLDSGKTILNTCIEQYQKVFVNISVVISNDDKLGKMRIGSGVNTVVSEHSINGMSQSLITGIQSQPDVGAWLIALGDMPYVKSETISNLAGKATTNNIVVPECDHRRGNPVIFGRDFQTQLLSLQGDVGAKQLIQENQSLILTVPVSDQGVLLDIDRPEDLR